MSAQLSAPMQKLLDRVHALAETSRNTGAHNFGILVSGNPYRTALALEKRGLVHVRYQSSSRGWVTPSEDA